MIKQFFTFDIDAYAHVVAEGDVLKPAATSSRCDGADGALAGGYGLYDMTDKILFSADAFRQLRRAERRDFRR